MPAYAWAIDETYGSTGLQASGGIIELYVSLLAGLSFILEKMIMTAL